MEGSAWVPMRDVQAGGRGAEDTALSMPQHVETYMFPLHLGVCILKFPSAVLGGCPRGLSLLGLMSNTHIYVYMYLANGSVQIANGSVRILNFAGSVPPASKTNFAGLKTWDVKTDAATCRCSSANGSANKSEAPSIQYR